VDVVDVRVCPSSVRSFQLNSILETDGQTDGRTDWGSLLDGVSHNVSEWDNSCEEKALLNKCDLSARLKAAWITVDITTQ